MANNLGVDLMLSSNEDGTGDLIIGSNGDFFTTQDYEQNMDQNLLPYDGYVCISETILRILQTNKGSWCFDVSFGADVNLYLSQTIDSDFFLLKEKIEMELLRDDRIISIEKIDITILSENVINIELQVLILGQNGISNFVFPYSL